MSKSKRKRFLLISLTLINIIACVFVGRYFLLAHARQTGSDIIDDGKTGSDPPDAAHVVVRDPRPSLSTDLQWELNMGGSGEDILHDVFELGAYYLFGQTDSKDFDFKRTEGVVCLFLITLSKEGSVQKTLAFNEGHTYAGAAVTDDGFAVLSNDANSDFYLTLISFGGLLVKTKNLGTQSLETGKEIICHNGDIVIAVEVKNRLIDKTEVQVLFVDPDFNILALRYPSRPASLSFVSILPYGANILLTVNAFDGVITFSSLYVIKKTANYDSYDKLSSISHTVLDIIPWGAGKYLMMYRMNNNGQALLMTLQNNLSSQNIDLDLGGVTGGKIVPSSSGYIIAMYTESGMKTVHFDNSLNIMTDIESAGGMDKVYAFTPTSASVVIIGSSGNDIAVNAYIGDKTEYHRSFGGSKSDTPIAVLPSGNSMIIFGNSHSSDKDVGKNFGSSDVWIAKIRI